ncbi:DNA ligase 4-like [Anopheles stephensi]|uniref:DNA ligase 4-like n=1 Tax=Anopheles stephensi TaxID=30069 RepID=UPI0016587BF6|nr:DNA ligase 4-like [Anopheles stephensi]
MCAKQDSFSELSSLLEKVRHAPLPAKELMLRKFFQDFELYRQSFGDADNKPSIYPSLRLLVPGMDRARKAYGLRERTLAEAYIRALGLDRRNEEVQRLLGAGSDLAERLGPLLHGRCPAVGDLTVGDVNSRLDAIGAGRAVAARDELVALIERGSPLDQRWLVRIVLKNLRLGVSNRRILQLYHPNAPTLYDGASDLKQLVQQIETQAPAGELELVSGGGPVLLLTHFIRPMLCQRVELRQVGELLRRDTYWCETKMDGERFQMHWDGLSFRYYSRNGHDYSDAFGRSADQVGGTLTPMLATLIAPTTRDLILDGEMMVFDRRDLRFRDKCDGTDVKALRTGNADQRPCFCVYDVLYHNGRSLTGVPYAERANLLRHTVREQFGFLQHCRRERVRDAEHLIELINTAIDARQEGVVLKREDAPYQPNRRAGTGWYKIKPDYIEGLVVDFDLLVMGGFYNLRRTHVNTFLVGVGRGPGEYVSVAKVSMGLSVAEWQQLNQSLRSHWRTEPVDGMHCGRTTPDVWIAPGSSIVLQLKGSELVRSDSYAAGYTIRFPRIVTTRADKLPDEVCTLAELEQLASGTSGHSPADSSARTRKSTKLAKRHVTLEDLNAPATVQRPNRAKKRLIAAERTTARPEREASPLPDGMLHGRDVCVMAVGNYPGAPTIDTLERLVRRHGGRAVANPSPATYAIVAGRVTFKVRKYMETGRWDVVREDWLLRAGMEHRLEPFRPEHILTATEPTRMKLAKQYDRYGDSYTRPITPSSFSALLSRMTGEEGLPTSSLTLRELMHAETTLLGVRIARRMRLFRGLSARLYVKPEEKEDEEQASFGVERYRAQREMLRFVQHGGYWLRDTEPGVVRYVFVASSSAVDPPPYGDVEAWIDTVTGPDRELTSPPVLLRVHWIGRSIEAGRLCNETDFFVPD